MITRFPLVNDDGSGTLGSILDDAWQTGLYDAMDDAYAPNEQTTAATGTQNNFNVTSKFTVLRCTGAAPNFTGFTVNGAAPQEGDRVILICLGTTLKVSHQNGSSTAENRIICPSTNGQMVGVNARMDLIYDTTTDRWRTAVPDVGTPISPAFSAGDYTANGAMTWTVASGDVQTRAWSLDGKTMKVAVTINNTTVGGVLSNQLRVAIPSGYASAKEIWVVGLLIDNGTRVIGRVQVDAAGSTINITRSDAANFSASAGATSVFFSIDFEVQ